MNMEFFRLINNLAYQNRIIDEIMIFFSKYVPYMFMLIMVIVFLRGILNKNLECRQSAVSTLIFTIINMIISSIIGGIYYVDRPFVHNKVNLLFHHVQDASFPSDHATGTMSIARGFASYNKWLSIALTVLSLFVGFSRVYVGHHYPADVIGAYIMVLFTSWIYNLKLRNIVINLYKAIEDKIIIRLGLSNGDIKTL
ncbi:phosphatase PAP2 family protein [Clostridium sp. 19966]|uniref:phosphatase PAP2 family protein n=1 Tax=Clostridium sp. 19966 TaxID=2768166 RepID=UPI0028DD9164|nr:phosphatase PAP2 family protein [Clostridium sp. 19966]MDT8716496.1 phosphatase PAP2 family protein [Clostridium sp. 19966]